MGKIMWAAITYLKAGRSLKFCAVCGISAITFPVELGLSRNQNHKKVDSHMNPMIYKLIGIGFMYQTEMAIKLQITDI